MKSQLAALLTLVSLPIGGCKTEPPPRDASAIRADVEALEVENGRAPLPGVLTSGQLTEEQLAGLAEAGYTTFVSLRLPTEEGAGWEEARAEQLDVRFIRIPVEGADGVTEANARRLSAVLADAEGPTVVYCGSSNRVGALFALEAFYVDGLGPEDALAVGQAAGVTRLEPRVRALLGMNAE